jgi:hypothetical protein
MLLKHTKEIAANPYRQRSTQLFQAFACYAALRKKQANMTIKQFSNATVSTTAEQARQLCCTR